MMLVRPFITMAAAIVATAFAVPAGAAEPPRVVASILPVHALAAMVLGDVASPALLVPPRASPHAFSLKPSDAEALADADLVVWVGPGFEVFLEDVLDGVAPEARHLAMIEQPGVVTLPVREGGVWDEHDHGHDEAAHDHEDEGEGEDHEGEHAAEDDHDHGAVDGHVWLDPRNATAMVRAIAGTLAAIDPGRAPVYAANAEAAIAVLGRLDAEIAETLASAGDRPFFVFHDAYQYLEARYGLNAAGSITLHPEQPPSAQRLIEIRKRVGALRTPCVFAESQFPDRLVAVVVEGMDARTAVLDPLGAGPSGPESYGTLLRGLAAAMTGCLAADATN